VLGHGQPNLAIRVEENVLRAQSPSKGWFG
jgi:hypothetical protein